jgi:hypothetical protein
MNLDQLLAVGLIGAMMVAFIWGWKARRLGISTN